MGTSTLRTSAGSNWRIQQTPNPAAVRGGVFYAVSCIGPKTCEAVGGYENKAGLQVPFAEARSSAGWRKTAIPSPSGSPWSSLFGVSCPAVGDCMAVGYGLNGTGAPQALSERWNGSSWRIEPTPTPAGARSFGLLAVSCSSASSCTATGDYLNHAGVPLTLAERWTGTRWTIQTTPNPAGAIASGLFGVSCPSSTECIAVGAYDTSAGQMLALAERWDGASWRLKTVPTPAGSVGGELFGVSCLPAKGCMAGGVFGKGGQLLPLAERWDGASWRLETVPSPAGSQGADFLGISCTAGGCAAAGVYATSTGRNQPLIDRWNGSGWTVQAAPNPVAATGAGFFADSCGAARACVAVGSFGTGSGPSRSLAEAWNAGHWVIQPTADPAGAAIYNNLLGVSCHSATSCVGVGYFTDSVGVDVALAERWNGVHWSIAATPNPAGAASTELEAVSCISARWCTAVGTYAKAHTQMILAEHWNGVRWSIQAMPTMPGRFAGVSCTSAHACIAAGQSGSSRALAAAWNGSTWQVHGIAIPAGAITAQFSAVACTSAKSCRAVGDYSTNSGVRPLAESWNGSAWTAELVPAPTGAQAPMLSAISCTSAAACTAVGSYFGTNIQATLAERWNGRSWQIQSSPSENGAANILTAVACGSATSCLAVGYYMPGGRGLPIAFSEEWTGGHWLIQPTPNPVGASSTLLEGLSCSSAAACTAVGYWFVINGPQLTLAMRTAR